MHSHTDKRTHTHTHTHIYIFTHTWDIYIDISIIRCMVINTVVTSKTCAIDMIEELDIMCDQVWGDVLTQSVLITSYTNDILNIINIIIAFTSLLLIIHQNTEIHFAVLCPVYSPAYISSIHSPAYWSSNHSVFFQYSTQS